MAYLTTFTDVGRSKFCGEKKTEDCPTYSDLLSVVRFKLMSSEIDFLCDPRDVENLENGNLHKVNGIVTVGGGRNVGSFNIEKVTECGEND